MGDIDGSSRAAHSAQSIDETEIKDDEQGFFGKLLGAFSGSETQTEEVANGGSAPPPRLHGMMNLRRMRVEDVATPKVEIVSVPSSITREELVSVFRESGLTRIPVYEGTLDTPIGMAHLKDFALTYGFNGCDEGEFDLAAMLRPLVFVPPSMSIGVLLAKMQTERRHLALVIDEYGGVDGLVTIEDLIEQVIGEIEDEHDIGEDELWQQEPSGCYIVQARAPLDEFEAEIGRSLTAHEEVDEEEIDTLGGLVFMLSGRIPARGEVIMHPEGAEFEVLDADARRIKRLRVRLPGLPE